MNQENQLRQLIRESIQEYIREIDEAGNRAALEAKMTKTQEAIDARKKKLNMEGLDEAYHDMMDKGKMKEMTSEIKMLEKSLAKYGKMLEKMDAKNAPKMEEMEDKDVEEEMIDEVSIDENDPESGPQLEEETEQVYEMLLMQKRAGIISETEYRIKVEEAKKKASAGLTKKQKSSISKKAHSGKDIGKKGKGFEKVAKAGEKQYGSKEAGERVAAAAMWKNAAKKAKSLKEEVQALFEDDLNEELEIGWTDLGDDFTKAIQGIFGGNVKLQDVKVRYRPSTDTGKQPELTFGATIPSVGDKDNYKGALIYTNFLPDGSGYVGYDNYSKDKETTAKEFNEKLIPVWKKASALVLGNILKNPEELNKATVGSGYKYEEKDLENLKKYVASIPNLAIKNK